MLTDWDSHEKVTVTQRAIKDSIVLDAASIAKLTIEGDFKGPSRYQLAFNGIANEKQHQAGINLKSDKPSALVTKQTDRIALVTRYCKRKLNM